MPELLPPLLSRGCRPGISILLGGNTFRCEEYDQESEYITFPIRHGGESKGNQVQFSFPTNKELCKECLDNILNLVNQIHQKYFESDVSTSKLEMLDNLYSVLVVGRDYTIDYANSRFDEVVRKHYKGNLDYCLNYLAEDDLARFRQAFDKALAGESTDIVVRAIEKNRNVFCMLKPYHGERVLVLARRVTADQKKGIILEDCGLTKKEMSVAKMIKSGWSTKEVAEYENVSLETVKWHCKQIRKKLGITNSGNTLNYFLNNLT